MGIGLAGYTPYGGTPPPFSDYYAGGRFFKQSYSSREDFSDLTTKPWDHPWPRHSSMHGGDFAFEMSFSAIPEPSTLIIWSALATLGIAVAWRQRKRAA
jgi:hypothetical protein